MALNITAAHGLQIKLGNGASTEVFTAIEGIHNGPSGPGFEPQFIEARHHSSDDTFQKPTVVKKTPVTFDIYYDSTNAQHQALIAAANTKLRKNFKMVLADEGDEEYTFSSYVQASFKGEVEGFNIYSITLPVDGDIVIA